MSSGEGIIDSSLNPLSQSSFINQIGQLELLSSLKSTQGSSENNNYSKNVNNIKAKNNGNNDNNYRHNKEDRNNDNLSPIINPTPNPNNDDNRNQDNSNYHINEQNDDFEDLFSQIINSNNNNNSSNNNSNNNNDNLIIDLPDKNIQSLDNNSSSSKNLSSSSPSSITTKIPSPQNSTSSLLATSFKSTKKDKKQKAVFKIVMPSSRSSSKITKPIIKPINSNNTNIKPITNTVANVNSTDSKSNKITKTTTTKKGTTRTNNKKTNNSLSGATRTNATPLIDKNGIFSDLKVLFIPKKIDKVRLGLMKSKVMAKEIKDKNKLKMIQNAIIVEPDWISQSIMFGKVLDVEPFLVNYMDQVNNNNNRDKNSKSILTSTQAHMKRNHEEPGKQQESLISSGKDNDDNQKIKRRRISFVTAATATMTSSSLPIECNIFQDPLTEMIFEAKKLQENGLYTDDEKDDGNYNDNENDVDVDNYDEETTINNIQYDDDDFEQENNKQQNSNDVVMDDDENSSSTTKSKYFGSFICMQKNVAGEINSNPNKDIIQKLQILYEHYERMKDHWRMLSYRKAISALKKYNKPITSYEEARNIFGIGERTAQKIMEIIETGRLQRIENLGEDDELIKKFIGNTLAMKWHAKGYRTFEDLLQNAKLTSAQRAGIIYYDDLQERIPRNEVTEISMCIERLAHTVDKNLECITVGSYRRGSSSCGDIDIMITKNDSKGKNHLGILSKLLPILRRESIIVHDLAQHHGKESLSERYRGICKLPGGKNRRLDLFTVPYNEIGAALLSYTGNDLFNRSMRLLARKKKMRLNHHGLYGNIIRGNGGIKYSEGTLIAQKTEIEIFDALGVPYRSPGERNC
nr:72_t:CDS:10 [Entrophospora candida]